MENSRKYLPKYQEKWLPSGNLQYPDGVNIHYYPFSFGEILKINQSNLDEIAMYNMMLEGVEIIGMPVEDLTFYDALYLGWRRKTASLGVSMLDIKSYCPNCDTTNITVFDLTELKYIDVEMKAMPAKTVICGEELHFGFITIKDYMELQSKDLHKDVLAVYAKSVTNRSYEEAYEIISSAMGNDVDKLETLNRILYHGVKPINVTCRGCGQEYAIRITDSSEVEILKPFRGEEVIIRDEISFGD